MSHDIQDANVTDELDDNWAEWGRPEPWVPQSPPKGFGFKVRPVDPKTAARFAVTRHLDYLCHADTLDLILGKVGEKKPREVLRYLHGNATATMNDLRNLVEDEPLTLDALRKTIDRMNDGFEESGVTLFVNKTGNLDEDRVWLDITPTIPVE